MTRSVEELSEQWLHRFNMPAASDVRRLREQLGRVERQLNRVAKDLADREDAAAAPRSRSNARPRAASKPRTPRSR
jgi:hypothetical protein